MSKDEIVDFLELVRQRVLCSYSTPHFCDCKYGAAKSKALKGFQSNEQTGCPEMRDVVALLSAIPPEVFVEAEHAVRQQAFEAFKRFSQEQRENNGK